MRIWVTKNPAAPSSQAETIPCFLFLNAKTISSRTGRMRLTNKVIQQEKMDDTGTMIHSPFRSVIQSMISSSTEAFSS